MKLTELYAQTPVAQHGSIVVVGERVYVRSAEGTDEYVLDGAGELRLVRSDTDNPLAAIKSDLAKIKAKLGA